jgi:tRNA-dihydrouridine synthase
VNVLFDNCTSPRLANTLDGFITADGHRAFHIKDLAELPNGRNSADIEWIDLLRKNNQNWIFISGDGRILKNSAEKAALRSAGLHGFILSPAYQKTMLHQVAATIVWKWPEIEAVARLLAPPSMHEIPIGRIQKIRQLNF